MTQWPRVSEDPENRKISIVTSVSICTVTITTNVVNERYSTML